MKRGLNNSINQDETAVELVKRVMLDPEQRKKMLRIYDEMVEEIKHNGIFRYEILNLLERNPGTIKVYRDRCSDSYVLKVNDRDFADCIMGAFWKYSMEAYERGEKAYIARTRCDNVLTDPSRMIYIYKDLKVFERYLSGIYSKVTKRNDDGYNMVK